MCIQRGDSTLKLKDKKDPRGQESSMSIKIKSKVGRTGLTASEETVNSHVCALMWERLCGR